MARADFALLLFCVALLGVAVAQQTCGPPQSPCCGDCQAVIDAECGFACAAGPTSPECLTCSGCPAPPCQRDFGTVCTICALSSGTGPGALACPSLASPCQIAGMCAAVCANPTSLGCQSCIALSACGSTDLACQLPKVCTICAEHADPDPAVCSQLCLPPPTQNPCADTDFFCQGTAACTAVCVKDFTGAACAGCLACQQNPAVCGASVCVACHQYATFDDAFVFPLCAACMGNEPYVPNLTSLSRHKVPQWYNDAKLGMFIHYGTFTIPHWAPDDGTRFGDLVSADNLDETLGKVPYAEWYPNAIQVPNSPFQQHHNSVYGANFPYTNFATQFKQSARNFSPRSMARVAKNMGAKYVVLTTKHHEGFRLWNSSVHHPLPNFDSYQLDFNLVANLADAVRDAGMKMGLYYSGGFDWTIKYNPTAAEFINPPESPEYVAYTKAHYDELIQSIRPSMLWNDVSSPVLFPRRQLFAEYYNAIPDGLVNDRWNALSLPYLLAANPEHVTGDISTQETSTQFVLKPTKWEYTSGIDNGFAYNSNSLPSSFLTADQMVDQFIDIVSKNGNWLLNVAVDLNGDVPPQYATPLEGFGKWNRRFEEAIYGTRPFTVAEGSILEHANSASPPRVRFTLTDQALYVFFLDTPSECNQRCTLTLQNLKLSSASTTIVKLPDDDDNSSDSLPYQACAQRREISVTIPKFRGYATVLRVSPPPVYEVHQPVCAATTASQFLGANNQAQVTVKEGCVAGQVDFVVSTTSTAGYIGAVFLNLSPEVASGVTVSGDEVKSFQLNSNTILSAGGANDISGASSPCPCDMAILLKKKPTTTMFTVSGITIASVLSQNVGVSLLSKPNTQLSKLKGTFPSSTSSSSCSVSSAAAFVADLDVADSSSSSTAVAVGVATAVGGMVALVVGALVWRWRGRPTANATPAACETSTAVQVASNEGDAAGPAAADGQSPSLELVARSYANIDGEVAPTQPAA